MSHSPRFSRRTLIKAGALTAAASTLPHAARADINDRRFLFVIGAVGGASLIDSFLPVVENQSAYPQHNELVAYPESLITQPSGSAFRCVDLNNLFNVGGLPVPGNFTVDFVNNHGADMAVMTQNCTSVNHLLAQKRALTGAGINNGRTLLEAMALRHGDGLLLPAVNMMDAGYLQQGDDTELPAFARAEPIADPFGFAFSTDPSKGVLATADDASRLAPLLARARSVREQLDDTSIFGRTFAKTPLLKAWRQSRKDKVPTMQTQDLISKLMLYASGDAPLDAYGLSSSEDLALLQATFSDLDNDPFEAQAALAFLMVRHGVSCAVGLSPSFSVPRIEGLNIVNTPLGFDFSHTDHVTTQKGMWGRVLRVTDGLISLLKNQPLDDANPTGETLWDRSLVYVATDFGRSKNRPGGAAQFSTGHDINNGNVILSPLIGGNRIYGGVDEATCQTFGFDPVTGNADPNVTMAEGDIYSAICQALDVPFAGRREFPSFVRA